MACCYECIVSTVVKLIDKKNIILWLSDQNNFFLQECLHYHISFSHFVFSLALQVFACVLMWDEYEMIFHPITSLITSQSGVGEIFGELFISKKDTHSSLVQL